MAFRPKIGLVSCSGEDCPGGNISRAATLKVLHEMRPNETVTICLPLFLAGGEGERGFAKTFPTITIDGCSKMCAARSTAHLSNEPAVRLNVDDFSSGQPQDPAEKWAIGASRGILDRLADVISEHVDRLREEWR